MEYEITGNPTWANKEHTLTEFSNSKHMYSVIGLSFLLKIRL